MAALVFLPYVLPYNKLGKRRMLALLHVGHCGGKVMAQFTWLHISDWHQKGASVEPDRRVTLSKLLADISDRTYLSPGLARIDAIFFTGDIAWGGRDEEFETARTELIEPLTNLLGADAQILFVPGNHDIDRGAIDRLPKEWNENIAHPDLNATRIALEDYIAKPAHSSIINAPLAAFGKLYSRYDPSYSIEKLFHVTHFNIAGKRIGIVGLNTAWPCARSYLHSKYMKKKSKKAVSDFWDYGMLKLTETQIREAVAKMGTCDVAFALMHHPSNWMHEHEQARLEQLITSSFHIVLHGHEHRPRVNRTSGVYGDLVTVPAGAAYYRRFVEDPRYNNSYSFGMLDLDERSGSLFHRRWADDRDSWIADDRFWLDGRSSFMLSRAKGDRVRAARHELFELQRQFVPYTRKRIARRIEVTLGHEPLDIDGEMFINARVEYDIDLEPGDPEAFPLKVDDNKRIATHPNPKVSKRNIRWLSVSLDEQTLEGVGGGEVALPKEACRIKCKYEMLETLDGVWCFYLNRFAVKVKFYFKFSTAHDYELLPLAGFPARDPPARNQVLEFDAVETDSLALPRQGYLVQWYPKRG